MTQDERWQKRYDEVVEFISNNHRSPSRHRIEEHDMLNWIKANRKKMNAGELCRGTKGRAIEYVQRIASLDGSVQKKESVGIE